MCATRDPCARTARRISNSRRTIMPGAKMSPTKPRTDRAPPLCAHVRNEDWRLPCLRSGRSPGTRTGGGQARQDHLANVPVDVASGQRFFDDHQHTGCGRVTFEGFPRVGFYPTSDDDGGDTSSLEMSCRVGIGADAETVDPPRSHRCHDGIDHALPASDSQDCHDYLSFLRLVAATDSPQRESTGVVCNRRLPPLNTDQPRWQVSGRDRISGLANALISPMIIERIEDLGTCQAWVLGDLFTDFQK